MRSLAEQLGEEIDLIMTVWEDAKQSSNHTRFDSRYNRWKKRISQILESNISKSEAKDFESADDVSIVMGEGFLNYNTKRVNSSLEHLYALIEELNKNPGSIVTANQQTQTASESKPISNNVFIVHGHDETNTSNLRDIIKTEFGLTPIILSSKPAKGRTIIEKFEQEASKAAYAFVMLTPDDFVDRSGESYEQPRPNALFELGWFYGRIGREKVCILYKQGTNIPSDLAGINRIEFSDSVKDKFLDIRRELTDAGLISTGEGK